MKSFPGSPELHDILNIGENFQRRSYVNLEDRSDAERLVKSLFNAGFDAGIESVLNLPQNELDQAKTWHDEGADPLNFPHALQASMTIHLDWAKQQVLNNHEISLTDPRVKNVHTHLCELVALLLALRQEADRPLEWRRLVEAGCISALELLTLTERPVKPPVEPVPESTHGRLVRAGDQVTYLWVTASSMVAALRKCDTEAANRYEKGIKEIKEAIYKLRDIDMK